ncbi:MAG TPA: sigma-70 family RNA polymerase sigma factor [Sphingobacteriaceae bacterium]|nr:sigma-70 family RNA polymerase sigma factor [Sphingobacteriaceae bacterium]
MIANKNDIISWVKIYTKDLLNYAITKVPQKEIAEDLVQDTFLSAYQSYKSYKGESNVKTWLFSILKHKIADYYRLKYKENVEFDCINQFFDENSRWRSEYRPTKWGDEKELLDDPEFSKALNACFEKLPQKWSSAVRFKYLEEYDSKAICSELEITSSNFWQIVHRAKLQLRNCLEIKWFKQ